MRLQVTGSNKGIGLAVVKLLTQQWDGVVYLTSRSQELGMKAVKELLAESKSLDDKGDRLRYHQLDLNSQQSIERLATHLKKEHGHIDILVNNAAIAFGVGLHS